MKPTCFLKIWLKRILIIPLDSGLNNQLRHLCVSKPGSKAEKKKEMSADRALSVWGAFLEQLLSVMFLSKQVPLTCSPVRNKNCYTPNEQNALKL